MPGKHAPDSPRSYYVSLARAGGAALGAVALMVIAVVILLSRGGEEDKRAGGPGPTIESPRPTVSRSPSPRPSASTVRPSPTASVLSKGQIIVDVLNGTSRQGLAARTQNEITAEGYRVGRVGNAERLERSTIFYSPGARDEALLFQKDFPDFSVLRQSSAIGDATLRVVLGADYP